MKGNYAIRPLKDNANNSKIVAVTKCGYSVAEGCTSNGDDGLVLYICEMAYIYMYIYTNPSSDAAETPLAQSWLQKKGVVFDGHAVGETNKQRSTFLGSTKNGRRNL